MKPSLYTSHLHHTHILFNTCAKAAPCWQALWVVLISLLLPLAETHATELFNGIAIDFGQTFLHEKRAMQLHAVLSPQETQIVANAMERIAATINEAHSASLQERLAWRKNTLAQNTELRNVLRASGADQHLGLAVKQIHHWKISAQRIEFDVDYYMPTRVGAPPQIYRDRYAVSLISKGWQFSGHPDATPIGQLSCQYINALWACPETP